MMPSVERGPYAILADVVLLHCRLVAFHAAVEESVGGDAETTPTPRNRSWLAARGSTADHDLARPVTRTARTSTGSRNSERPRASSPRSIAQRSV